MIYTSKATNHIPTYLGLDGPKTVPKNHLIAEECTVVPASPNKNPLLGIEQDEIAKPDSLWEQHLIIQSLQFLGAPVREVRSYLRRFLTPGDVDERVRITLMGENDIAGEIVKKRTNVQKQFTISQREER